MRKLLALALIAATASFTATAQDETVNGNLTVTGSVSAAAQGSFIGSGRNTATKDINLIFGNFPTGGQFVQFFWSSGSQRFVYSNDLQVGGSIFIRDNTFLGYAKDTAASNISLSFGGTNTKTLTWNSGQQSFDFNDNVAIDGTGTVNVLEILGGSDLSETFDVSDASKVEPGTVVSIDTKNAGQLAVSTEPYDKKVAGIVSGANGLNTGMRMGQKGSLADGAHPVALTGRVYCKVDATAAAVEPGDLLTTSATPGHAMKVLDHAQAPGSILGKAMTPLAQGEQGLVLVLVSLQ